MPKARDFPKLYKKLDIDLAKLGCVMLDVYPFPVTELVEGGEQDLYFADPEKTPGLRFAQGAVAEKTAHLTLLFGLLKGGKEWKDEIDTVMEGWNPPSVRIKEVSFFPSSVPNQDYSVIIGHVDLTDEIQDAHDRLSLLPHVDTFPGFKPHVTLAYIKNGPSGVKWTDTAREKWVKTLDFEYSGLSLSPFGLNYGDE